MTFRNVCFVILHISFSWKSIYFRYKYTFVKRVTFMIKHCKGLRIIYLVLVKYEYFPCWKIFQINAVYSKRIHI